MVYYRLKFTLSGQPRTALLTDRGWTLISGTAGQDALLNLICPMPVFVPEADSESKAIMASEVAAQAAELLKAEIES